MSSAVHFLVEPIFLRGFSVSLHLVLLLVIFVSWVFLKSKAGFGEDSSGRFIVTFCSYYNQSLICCLIASSFSLVFCLLKLFYWYRNGWSEEILVPVLDFGLRTLAWGAVFFYLYTQVNKSYGLKFPIFLRVWWGVYSCFSCYCLVIDSKYPSLSFQFLVSDVVSVITNLFLCFVGFMVKTVNGRSPLEERLLIDQSNSDVINGFELKECKGEETVTPYSNAGIFSILTFSWISPLIATGHKKILDLEDVPQLASSDSVTSNIHIIRTKLESDCGTINRVTTLSLVKGLIYSSWKEILFTAFLAFIHTLASCVGPYSIDAFVQYLNGRRNFKNQGYILVSVLFLAKLVESLSMRHWFFRLQLVGIRMRAALVAMIYNKGLNLSCESRQQHTSGEIINFMTVDAERIGEFSWHMHDLWVVVLQVILAVIILYKNLGIASIAALFTTIAIMLASIPLGQLEEKFQDEIMESKDTRMKAMSEILSNMRILKLQGWEMKFFHKISELRNTEAGWLKKYLYTSATMTFLFCVAPTFLSLITFGTCMVLGIPLESGKILSSIATFGIFQESIYNLPDTVSMIVQTKVSLDRIVSFLRLDDLQSDIVEKLPRGSTDTAIEIVDGNFSWDLSSTNPTLKDINFRVQHSMRVAVCGTVGSGKSSLLSSILGEVPKISGTLRVCGTKAYVAQSPWIQSGKIEDNILFGKAMDRGRYERVLEVCCLKMDLERLTFGDQTIIGERGINLSGGQKQRIQIARALYQDADIYLFDDPFSAVDAHTGSHLFKECLLGFLRSKTIVYVTHQVEFLPAADLILVVKDGRITQAGKYDDLLISGTDFMELVGARNEALSALNPVEEQPVSLTFKENRFMNDDVGHVEHGEIQAQREAYGETKDGDIVDATNLDGQLIQEEEREKGGVGLSVYLKYLTAAHGGALVPFIILSQILFQVLEIGSDYWISWATPLSRDDEPAVSGSTLIIVYAALSIGSSLWILAKTTLTVTAGYKTATLLFNKLTLSVFRAPMSFFDSTPSGRILNRASTDQSAVDMSIPFEVATFAFTIIQLLGVIAVMSLVSWQVFIIFIPTMAACIWYQRYYISSARELARLNGVSEAPVIQHFSETISGSTTIRSFDQESRFQDTILNLVDNCSRPNFHAAGAMEWLSFRLDLVCSITFTFCLVFLVTVPEGMINPAIAGLCVTYGLYLNGVQAWLVSVFCEMENKIISVERILQYTSIPNEPPLVIEQNRPNPTWPTRGEIEIRDLQVRYAPQMPLVLRGITCTFQGGRKTGIVGRTGCGKSTLIQTLFRIVEPWAGQIMIDDIDISLIGLHDLRSRLSIIPQDPTMFEGTIRSNLDPLEEFTDEQIWEALDKCQLGDEVRKKEEKLDSAVCENGENWSVGQRQLVCLGRVLLKKNKILVLDEATASVDAATDNLIQHTLGQHFSDCTVVTIAHRITSILNGDMVLLLSHGVIEEYDTPTRLLENRSSSFAQLVAEYTLRTSSR